MLISARWAVAEKARVRTGAGWCLLAWMSPRWTTRTAGAYVAAMAGAGAQRPRVQSDRRHRDLILDVARKSIKENKRLQCYQELNQTGEEQPLRWRRDGGAKPEQAPRRNGAVISPTSLPAKTSRLWPNPSGLVPAGPPPHTPNVGGNFGIPSRQWATVGPLRIRLRRRKVAALSRCGKAVLCGAAFLQADTSVTAPACGVGLRFSPNGRVLSSQGKVRSPQDT